MESQQQEPTFQDFRSTSELRHGLYMDWWIQQLISSMAIHRAQLGQGTTESPVLIGEQMNESIVPDIILTCSKQ